MADDPKPVPTNDPTLTFLPHLVATVTGAATGFLTTKLGLSEGDSTILASAIGAVAGALITTAVHWAQAAWAKYTR